MHAVRLLTARREPLNESPSEKEGKLRVLPDTVRVRRPSMKVPPKRKGNGRTRGRGLPAARSLNESPSEKEGKSRIVGTVFRWCCNPQ